MDQELLYAASAFAIAACLPSSGSHVP